MRVIARLFSGALVGAVAVLLACCQEQITFPAPVLRTLVPATTSAGQPSFTLELTGNNFTPSSIVEWNGSPRVTLFVTTKELQAQILATDVQNAGQASIVVITQPPGGGTTQPLIFTITSVLSGVPTISSISPSGVSTGGGSFTLTVNGLGFVSLATVTVNGNIRPTGFLGSDTLQATVLASDIASAGSLQIAVVNPEPGGGSSNFVNLPVSNPVPAITALSPTSALAGSTATSLAVTGTNLVPDSVVTFNGAPRTTAFTNNTSIQASLTPGDFADAGTVQVAVVNPADGGIGGGTSNVLMFAVDATELAGLPMIVDVAPNGTQANTGICGATCTTGKPTLTTAGPSMSQSGEFIAFASTSTNLLTTPVNTSSGVFLRNTCLSNTVKFGGSGSCVPKTSLVSLGPDGNVANGPSFEPSLDGGGTQVAYTSTASNLVDYVVVPGGPRQVYWETPCTGTTGCTGSTDTALVSISADGLSPGNGESYNPAISADGRYVAFVSLATNLLLTPPVGGFDGVTPQVFIRDTCSVAPPFALGGCVPTTYLLSESPDGTAAGDGPSSNPTVANEGLYVAFVSSATNIVPGSNPDATGEIFESSTCVTTIGTVGNTCAPVTILISTPDGVTPADGTNAQPSISEEGRFVAFASTADNLIAGVGPLQQIYVRDTCTEVDVTITTTCSATTLLASTPDGTTPANGLSEKPSINQCSSGLAVATTGGCVNGQPIAFASLATNLGPLAANVENGVENVFIRNACLNPVVTTATTTSCLPYTLLASQPSGTTPPPANGKSIAPAISGDGNTVSFISFANNLVANDSSTFQDIFLSTADLTFTFTLTLKDQVNTAGGTVTDTTGQIDCTESAGVNGAPPLQSGTCTATYISGTSITLTATATTGATFMSWAGTVLGTNCTATPATTPATSDTCNFAVVANNTATATFQ